MNWLKDRKNLPAIVAILVIVIGGAVVGALFATGNFPGQQPAQVASTDTVTTATPPGAVTTVTTAPPMPMPASMPASVASKRQAAANMMSKKMAGKKMAPGMQKQGMAATIGAPAAPGMPGTPAVPGTPATANGQAPAGAKTADAKPVDVATGPDPFNLPKVEGPAGPMLKRSDMPTVPNLILTNYHTPRPIVKDPGPDGPGGPGGQASAGSRRMAGVLFGDGVYAILETAGKTESVQPGDTVDGGKVISIEADHLTIRTDDDRLIRVPLSGTPTGGGAASGYPGGGGGGGFPGGGFPGGSFPGGGSPPGMGGYPGGGFRGGPPMGGGGRPPY